MVVRAGGESSLEVLCLPLATRSLRFPLDEVFRVEHVGFDSVCSDGSSLGLREAVSLVHAGVA